MDFLSSLFAFDRSRRLLLGFDSPIQAGIFIAAIIPWIRFTSWSANNHIGKCYTAVSLVVEIILVYLLSRTGSRGPMCALLVAFAIEVALCFRVGDYRRAKFLLLRSGIMTIALVFFVSLSGFGGRFAEAANFSDRSIHNRLEILKHARPLLLLNPLHGVGWGWSGHHYSQWFEPQHLHYLYNTLSNEYLQIGVDLGMPILFIVLFFLCSVLAWPWFQSLPRQGMRPVLACKAYCSFVVFAAVSWATTFHGSPTLDLMLLVVFILNALLAKPIFEKRAFIVGIVGAISVIAMFLLIPSPTANLHVAMHDNSTVELRRVPASASLNTRTLVFVDKDVLEPVYGQTLRLMLDRPMLDGKTYVALPFKKGPQHFYSGTDICISFGSSIALLQETSLPPLRQLIIAHPRTYPPKKLPVAGSINVILPAIDEAGVNESWLRYCRENKIPVRITPDSGLDIQHRAEMFFITSN